MAVNSEARSQFFWPVVLLITGAFIGLALGLRFGLRSVESIVQQAEQATGQMRCGTGLPVILFGSPVIGAVLGGLPGLVALAFTGLREQNGVKSDWAAYWGK